MCMCMCVCVFVYVCVCVFVCVHVCMSHRCSLLRVVITWEIFNELIIADSQQLLQNVSVRGQLMKVHGPNHSVTTVVNLLR